MDLEKYSMLLGCPRPTGSPSSPELVIKAHRMAAQACFTAAAALCRKALSNSRVAVASGVGKPLICFQCKSYFFFGGGL